MFVTHLVLADFRSYETLDLPLTPGVTVLVGPNGQGKTNLVEAVEYLATLGSHRVAAEAPLIRSGAGSALVRARIQAGLDDPRQLLAEIELLPGRANKASLNRSPLRRPRDLLGSLRAVVFSPDDLALVKGDPSERRTFLDELVVARWPRFAGVRADYDRVLKQRSALLKSLSGRSRHAAIDGAASLGVWDESQARFGAELVHARLATLADLAPLLAQAYADLAPSGDVATATYRSSSLPDDVPANTDPAHQTQPDVILREGAGSSDRVALDAATSRGITVFGVDELASMLLAAMEFRRDEEIARGLSLVGPHRDDVTLRLGEFPAKGYASHGECWSFALALRLAAFGRLRTDGVEPVLILDDVFAELDQTRRDRLAALVGDAEQVLITAAVAEDVPARLGGRRLRVADSKVSEAA